MKKIFKSFLPLLLIAVFNLVIVLVNFYGSFKILGSDAGAYSLDWQKLLPLHFYTWGDYINLGFFSAINLTQIPNALFNLLFNTTSWTGRFVLLFLSNSCYFFLLIEIYKDFLKSFDLTIIFCLFMASLFYNYNFFTLSALSQPITAYHLIYIFLPLSLLFFLRYLKSGSFVYLLISAITLVFSLTVNMAHFSVICFLILALFFYKQRKSMNSFLKVSVRPLLLLGLLFLTLSSYIILPLIAVRQNPYDFAYNNPFYVDYIPTSKYASTYTSILNVFVLRETPWLRDISFYEKFSGFYNTLLSFLPIFLIAGILFSFLRNKNKEKARFTLFFLSLYLIGVFLVKGAHPPFEDLNLLPYKFPYFGIFRNNYDKFAPILQFTIPVLLANFFIIFHKKIKVLLFVFLFFLFLLVYPFTSEVLNERFKVKVPNSYFPLARQINSSSTLGTVLVLPNYHPTGYVWTNWYYGADYYPAFLDKRVINEMYFYLSSYREKDKINDMTDYILEQKLTLLPLSLGIFNIQGVIIDKTFLDNVDVKSGGGILDLYGQRKMRESIINIRGPKYALKEVYNSQEANYYRVDNYWFLPRFYIPQNIIYSPNNIEALPDLVGLGDWEIRSGIYLAENQPEIEKLGNLSRQDGTEVVERADEVMVKGELRNSVASLLEIEKLVNSEIVYPHVEHRPGSWQWRLTLLKEKYEEWKVRNKPEELLEKHLFYSSKRIAELGKFTDNADEERITRMAGLYREEMEGAVGEIKKLRNLEIGKFEEAVIKLRAYLETHRKKIDKLDISEDFKERIKAVFDDLEGKIVELGTKRDFSRLVYKVEIPKEGEYEIFVKDISELGINGLTNSLLTNEDWISLGERNFGEGEQELVLPFSGISGNLIDENLRIRDYQSGAIYRIGFDYEAPKGGGFFVAEGKEGRIAETNLPATGEGFRHFEKFFKSSSEVADASVHLSISVAEERNLEVRRIYQPEVMLRMDAENADKDGDNANRETLRTRKGVVPRITFVKINPTKYRVKIEGAKEPYTLVFSESFHEGWKAWVADNADINTDNADGVTDNAEYGAIVASYFNGEIKEGTHRNSFLEKATFETWGKEPLLEERHLLVNGYANSWYIKPEDVGGQENYEIIVEFQPQKLFYIGLGVSLITLMGSLIMLTGTQIMRRVKR